MLSERVYLRDKYRVEKAFWFVGYLPDMQVFYTLLQRVGFIVIFKEVARDRDGTPKGNVDVDHTSHLLRRAAGTGKLEYLEAARSKIERRK